MRVLVTGSRDWTDGETIRQVLIYFAEPPVTVVHGAARGADAIAGQIARKYGWAVEEHPAPWRDLGKRAGFVRNQHMVDLGADLCLAFIRNESRGATMCADLAEEAGIRTVRYRVTGL